MGSWKGLHPSPASLAELCAPYSGNGELGKMQQESERQMDDLTNGKRREVGRGARGISRQADPLPAYAKDERESLYNATAE